MEYTFLFSFSLPFAFFALFAVKSAYFFLRDAWRA
jgi:hypothetical protein